MHDDMKFLSEHFWHLLSEWRRLRQNLGDTLVASSDSMLEHSGRADARGTPLRAVKLLIPHLLRYEVGPDSDHHGDQVGAAASMLDDNLWLSDFSCCFSPGPDSLWSSYAINQLHRYRFGDEYYVAPETPYNAMWLLPHDLFNAVLRAFAMEVPLDGCGASEWYSDGWNRKFALHVLRIETLPSALIQHMSNRYVPPPGYRVGDANRSMCCYHKHNHTELPVVARISPPGAVWFDHEMHVSEDGMRLEASPGPMLTFAEVYSGLEHARDREDHCSTTLRYMIGSDGSAMMADDCENLHIIHLD